MPERDTAWPDGTPCWIDYGAPDVEAARTFYTSVLGWEYEGGEPEYGGYLICTKRGRAAGGMAAQSDAPQPPRWTVFFAASDAAATTERLRAAGGTVVVPPTQVGPMGTMVMAADPSGALFGLWQADRNTGIQVFNEPGSLVWEEGAFEDPAAARTFYSDVFGFTFSPVDGLGDYLTFATADRPLGGVSGISPGVAPGWTVCFAVASTDAAVAAVQGGGGKVVMAAEDTEYGRFALVEDPWGAPFSVMEVAEDGA